MNEMIERLDKIKAINQRALNASDEMELHDNLTELWTKEHIDWLIERAEYSLGGS